MMMMMMTEYVKSWQEIRSLGKNSCRWEDNSKIDQKHCMFHELD
jgi:hypothetical protein